MSSASLPGRLQRRALSGLIGALTALAMLCAPAVGRAAVSTFGSPLSVPATLDSAENLGYEGTDIPLPGSVFHIPHDAADTALWNVAAPAGSPTIPAGGQLLSFSLEGCARQPSGAPAPLTQIHFQELAPQPGGGAQIAATSQAFEIPVCGAGGASGSTVTTYTPTDFCVNAGNYIAFNDEGGFVPGEGGAAPPYPAGVPYEVIGSVQGATMDSFVRDGGTNNGATISPSDRTNHDGFASNPNEELMLQATLGTGPDALNFCPGGSKPNPESSSYSTQPALPALRIGKQTDGINHHGIASLAVYCRPATGCAGTILLTPLVAHSHVRPLHLSFTIAGAKTSHVAVHVPSALVALARKHRKGVSLALTATSAGKTVAQTVLLRIF